MASTWELFQKIQEKRAEIQVELAMVRHILRSLEHWLIEPDVPEAAKTEIQKLQGREHELITQFEEIDRWYQDLLAEDLV